MIGEHPDACPFCGASRDQFLSWREAENIYRVTAHEINRCVTQLTYTPKLGLEHAAYHIETEKSAVWIDCLSTFNRTLKQVRHILFTHPHFMGASNQYRQFWQAEVWLHALDAD